MLNLQVKIACEQKSRKMVHRGAESPPDFLLFLKCFTNVIKRNARNVKSRFHSFIYLERLGLLIHVTINCVQQYK